MNVICKRCAAGPYQTLAQWDNHISIHREMDTKQAHLDPTVLVKIQSSIDEMDTQDRAVQLQYEIP